MELMSALIKLLGSIIIVNSIKLIKETKSL